MRRSAVALAGLVLALLATAAALQARPAAGQDFGDAPDGVAAGYVGKPSVIGSFPAKAASGGPRHASSGPRLGTGWSGEGDSRQIDRDADDGAAVTARPCALSTLDLVLDVSRVPAGTPIYVNAWFDWNQDGDWRDGASGGCGPEWGVQNERVDRASFGAARVGSVRIRFRAGRVPKEYWWRVQVHVGAPAPNGGGAGVASAGGETEDYLHSHPERAAQVGLKCHWAFVDHGPTHNGRAIVLHYDLVTPWASTLDVRIKPSSVIRRLTGPNDGIRLGLAKHLTFVDVSFRSTKHVRKQRIQVVQIEVELRAVWTGGDAVVRAKCPVFVRHGPPNVATTANQDEQGGAGAAAAVDPIRPDPAQAGCRADFIRFDLRAEISARCDGIDPKLLTVAPGTGLITTLRSNRGLGSCGWSPSRRAMSCLFPKSARGQAGHLSVLVDKPFVRITIFITAGGYTERGTTHVLRQDWWRRDDGVYLCSQTIPRTDRQRCATIGTSPRLVDGSP